MGFRVWGVKIGVRVWDFWVRGLGFCIVSKSFQTPEVIPGARPCVFAVAMEMGGCGQFSGFRSYWVLVKGFKLSYHNQEPYLL